MTTKYVDHGAYGSCTFTGYISNTASNDNGVAGTTLTVTSVTGIINIGSQLSGGAVVAGTYISAFVSGTQGGVGVYTVAVLPTAANQIVRSTAGLVGIYALPLAVPLTWALPQEGDGTATTAATASATVSVDMSGWTFSSGSSTFSVMGCTALTIGAGANSATNAQYSATYSTMLANIVAAINLATAVNMVNIPTGWCSGNMVRNTVYARANGNNLELMTRAGSAGYNGLVAISFSNVTGSSSQTWAGGSGGCWGYFYTWRTMWPSALAAGAYGICGLAASGLLAGTMGNATLGGDVVRVRSNKTLWADNNAGFYIGFGGSRLVPLEIQIDDGTTWPADGSTPELKIVCYANFSNYYNMFQAAVAAGPVNLRATKYSSGERSLKFQLPSGSTATGYFAVSTNGNLSIHNADFDTSNATSAYAQLYVYAGDTNYANCFVRCRFKHKANAAFIGTTGTGRGAIEVVDTEFDATGASVPNSGVFNGFGGHASGLEVLFECCKFTGFPATSRLFANGAGTIYPNRIIFSNCSWGGLVAKGPVTLPPSGIYAVRTANYVSGYSQSGNRDFFNNTMSGYFDWDSGASYPTCNARLLDGTTAWVIKVIPTTDPLKISRNCPLELPRIGKIVPTADLLAQDVRTLKIHLAVRDSLTLTKQDVSLFVVYEDASGVLQVIDTYDYAGAALSTSTATWSNESAGQVLWGAAAHNKKEFSVTTSTAVKAGTEVGIFVRFGFSVADTTQTIFVDPDITVT